MNISEIKEKVLLSDFLSKLGHEPVKRGGTELIYHSPYRTDKRPSFSANDKSGLWYDHGDGIGGNIIDLAILVYGYISVKDVVRAINDMYSEYDLSVNLAKRAELKSKENEKKHEIDQVRQLGYNHAILDYLRNRGVLEMAIRSNLVREVYYDHIDDSGNRKRYFGAGWQNNSGGWDVRSKYAKICIGNKDILVKKGDNYRINVFEGMIDYLSALTEKTASTNDTTIVLGGLGLHDRGINYIKDHTYKEINLFLDHGTGGDKFTAIYKEHFPSAKDRRDLYSGFSDYNDKLCCILQQNNSAALKRML